MTDLGTLQGYATDFAFTNSMWATSDGALGQCFGASQRFAMWMIGEPADIHVVELEWEPGPASVYCSHFAVVVDELVVDLTARQFDPALPFPWVTPYEEWKAWYDNQFGGTTARGERIEA